MSEIRLKKQIDELRNSLFDKKNSEDEKGLKPANVNSKENPKANNNGFTAQGISIPWANPWKVPNNPTAINTIFVGSFFSIATDRPKKITENIIPHSIILEKVIENISMNKPAAPPTIINKTKKEGTVQMALPPICELTTPTQTIAKKWSNPKTGWESPS